MHCALRVRIRFVVCNPRLDLKELLLRIALAVAAPEIARVLGNLVGRLTRNQSMQQRTVLIECLLLCCLVDDDIDGRIGRAGARNLRARRLRLHFGHLAGADYDRKLTVQTPKL